ncbi:MAG: o-succinylbenzoate synthase [Candidatus Zixiibacteriota bacterium]
MKFHFHLRPYEVPFKQEFLTSRTATVLRRGLFVIAESEDGIRGAGEIAPLEHFSDESLETAKAAAEALSRRLDNTDVPRDISRLTSFLEECVDGSLPPSVIFGFETAVSDAISRSKGMQLAQLVDPGFTRQVPVNAVMSGYTDSIDRHNLAGFTAVKIKVGAASVDEDILRIQAARDALGGDVSIRIDANRAWDFESAAFALSQIRDLRIEYVEEPLQESELSRFDELFSGCAVPIALDETVRDRDMFQRLIKLDAVTTVVIKPTVLGGIARSRELIDHAHKFGKKAVVTSTLETGIGIAACLHLAASLGERVLPCGFDTLRYLTDSLIEESLIISDGRMAIPEAPGLGVTLRPGPAQ